MSIQRPQVKNEVVSIERDFSLARGTARRHHDANLFSIIQCQALVMEMDTWPLRKPLLRLVRATR
jgi:hypothetical protein